MPSVKFKDTQIINNSSITIEYEFAEYSDFKDWQKSQREAMQESVKSMVERMAFDSMLDQGFYDVQEEGPREEANASEPSVVDISVGKKPIKPTKH